MCAAATHEVKACVKPGEPTEKCRFRDGKAFSFNGRLHPSLAGWPKYFGRSTEWDNSGKQKGLRQKQELGGEAKLIFELANTYNKAEYLY